MPPRSIAILGLLTTSLTACDVPTEAPVLEQRWVLPVETTTIPVVDFLPETVREAGGSFEVEVDPVVTRLTLAEMCGSCAAADGLVLPKPAFEATFEESTTLPEEVTSLAVDAGTLTLDVTNTLGFDPLRPGGGGETGTLTVSLRDGFDGPVVASVTLDGSAGSLPDGATTTTSVSLDGVEVGSPVVLSARVVSPEGDPVEVDADGALAVAGRSGTLRIGTVGIEVAGRTVALERVSVDVADLDETLTDRIQSGSILLEVDNPFGVATRGSLVVAYPGGEIGKPLRVGAEPSSTVSLDYSGAELRSFLGQPDVALQGTVTVEAGAGAVEASPGQELRIEGALDVIVRIGG